jgi:hypothetical protein
MLTTLVIRADLLRASAYYVLDGPIIGADAATRQSKKLFAMRRARFVEPAESQHHAHAARG